jgi:hypothetical protein
MKDAVNKQEKKEKRTATKGVYTEKELRGKEKIMRRQKEGEGVLVTTDKSGKKAFLSTDKLKNKVDAHTKNDTEITRVEVEKIEAQMSGLATSVARVLRIGERWKHESRVRDAVKSKYSRIPALDITLKDHKGGDDLPVRPICRASESPNGILSDLISDYLAILADELADVNGSEVRSTEEVCAMLEDVNVKIRQDKQTRKDRGENIDDVESITNVIGSMDVKALYPSIDIERSVDIIKQVILDSNFEVELDSVEMGLHIASTNTQEEIDSYRLTDVCHRRRFKTGTRPGMTSKSITGSKKERAECNSWISPVREPTAAELRLMLSIIVGHAVREVMNNHVYQTGGVIRQQTSGGGAIGLRITGEVARIIMLIFDKLLRSKLSNLGIIDLIYARYVDDANSMYKAIQPGFRYDPVRNSLVLETEKVEEDCLVEADKRTFNIIQSVANSIWPEIQWTVDVPSNHDDGLMPMLDLKVGMKNGETTFQFYSKSMNTPFCIPARSAHSWVTKRSTLVQEGVRRMLTTSSNVTTERRRDIMEEWDRKLRFSGYDRVFRQRVITRAIQIYRSKKLESEKENGTPLYRSREWHKLDRERARERNKSTWYKGEGEIENYAPLILNPTEGGGFKDDIGKICQQFSDSHKMGIKVLERGGKKSDRDVQSDPLGVKNCGYLDCEIHKHPGAKGDCMGVNFGYSQTCIPCEEKGKLSVYLGETAQSVYLRGLQHRSTLDSHSEMSAMWKHSQIEHQSVKTDFRMEITGKFKTPLTRLEDEAVRLDLSEADITLNSKTQWHQPPLIRLVPERGNYLNDQVGADSLPETSQGEGEPMPRGRGRPRGRGVRGAARGAGRGVTRGTGRGVTRGTGRGARGATN